MSTEAGPSTEPQDPGPPPGGVGMALVLILLSLVVSIGLAELILRVAWDNPFRNETTDYLIKLEIQPAHRDLNVDRSALDSEKPVSRLRTDDRSYIMPSRRFEDPSFTIAFLGGSTTENSAVQEELRFPALVSSLLEKRGLRVNVLNAGKSGLTSQDSINLLFNHVLFDAPDVAVMMHGHNDIGRLAVSGKYSPRMAGPLTLRFALRSLTQWASLHSSIFGALRKWLTIRAAVPAALPPERIAADAEALPNEQYVARLRTFIGMCRAFGVEPVLLTQPAINIRTALTPNWTDPINSEIFNHLLREVGREEGVLVIDLVAHLMEEVADWNEPAVLFYDGVHLNDHGSQVVGAHIAERLYEKVLLPRTRAAKSQDSGRRPMTMKKPPSRLP